MKIIPGVSMKYLLVMESKFFSLLEKNLCHMFGIDYKNLRDSYFLEYRSEILGLDSLTLPSSYELLKAILEHRDAVLQYDYEHSSVLNYYKIHIKCEIFDKFSNFRNFDFGCLDYKECEKDDNLNRLGNATKYFFLPSHEIVCPYFVMGLIEDYKKGDYCVETLLAPLNIRGFFEKQTLVLCSF